MLNNPHTDTNDYSTIEFPFPDSWTEHYSVYCDGQDTRVFGKTMFIVIATFIAGIIMVLMDVIGR